MHFSLVKSWIWSALVCPIILIAEPMLFLEVGDPDFGSTKDFSLVDFNNDGSLDLLVEGDDGQFQLYLNKEDSMSSPMGIFSESKYKISEVQVGSVVGKVSLLNDDPSQNLSINQFNVASDGEDFFSVDGDGNIVVAKVLIGNEFLLNVQANLSNGQTLTRAFSLFSQQAPTGILFSAAIQSAQAPSSVSALNLVDMDGDGDLDLLTESNSGEFFFDANLIEVFDDPKLLYPQGESSIVVTSTDEVIGSFSSYDPDDPESEDAYQYSLVDGLGDESNDLFDLSASGELRANATLTSGIFSLRVRVTDPSGLFLERSFTLKKESNLKGVLITPFAGEISESISGGEDFRETNGTDSLILVDLDQDGDLDLISEDIAGRFFLNQNQMGEFSENLLLFPNPIIPFEANATIGTKVASLVPIGSDTNSENQTFSFELIQDESGPDSNLFSVGQDGSLVLDASPKAGVLKIKVKVSSQDGVFVENIFELIAQEPIRFAPDLVYLSSNSISENLSAGTIVGKLQANDKNPNPNVEFSLVGDSSKNFEISEDGFLKSLRPFDYETQSIFFITVRGTNQYLKSIEQELEVIIQDIFEDYDGDGIADHLDPDDDNDGFSDLQELEMGKDPLDKSDFPKFPPAGILLSTKSVFENLAIGTTIGYLEASGENLSATYTFRLLLDEHSAVPVSIESNGTVVVSGEIDFEKRNSISFKVRATNEFNLYIEQDFTIEVLDVDEILRPIPRTLDVLVESPDQVELYGTLLSDGNSENVEVGFLIGTQISLNLDDSSIKRIAAPLDAKDSSFSASYKLPDSGTYYFRSYAINEKGSVLGSLRSFDGGPAEKDDKFSDLWKGTTDPHNGWLVSDWFGPIKVFPNGWVFHHELGWLFFAEASNGVWLWREQNGWLWTGEGIFPFFFQNKVQDWLYYFTGGNGIHYFYDYFLKAVLNTDSGINLGSTDLEDSEAVVTAVNGQTVVEKVHGNYRYKNLEGITVWTIVQNYYGVWEIRTGLNLNGQSYGLEGVFDELPAGDYEMHPYEIDDEGVYIYHYQWNGTTQSTFYKIESVENGMVTSRFGNSLDHLDRVSYFFVDKVKAVEFFNTQNSSSDF